MPDTPCFPRRVRPRRHSAAVKSNGDLPVLDPMRFEDKLVPPLDARAGAGNPLGQREGKMATTLVDEMSERGTRIATRTTIAPR